MVVSPRISGVVAALMIVVGACADGREAPTAPDASATAPTASLNVKAMLASSSAIGDETSRLVAMIEDGEHRTQLSASLNRLSRAMEAGDALTARRALSAARADLRFIQSDADRDALRLALDAADESLTTTSTHGAIK